jgi:hypothetical protein
VQAQLKQLADQNQALLQHQQQIEQQLSQQRQQLAAQPVAPVTPASAAQPSSSALPDQSAAASALPAAPGASGASAAYSTASLPGAQPNGFGAGPLSNLRLWGYGEIYYTRPTGDGSRTQTDLARAVFGIGYHFDDRTEFNSEYEVEHAIASAADAGEFEVEQFYVDHRLTDRVGLRAGLFLMPFGLLN